MAKLSDPAVSALLGKPNFATLTTTNEDGSLTSSIIWFDVEDGRVAINGAHQRRPGPPLAGQPRARCRLALPIPDLENPYEYVEIRGTAEGSSEGADAHIDRLAKKYIGQDEYPYRQPGEERQKFFVNADVIRHQKQ